MVDSPLTAVVGQINHALITSIDGSTNQLWVIMSAVTVVEDGVASEVRRLGVPGYTAKYGRTPPPEGWGATMMHYGKLHADGTVGKRELIHNTLRIANDFSLARKTMADWKDRTDIVIKQVLEYNVLSTAIRAGKVPKFVNKVMESEKGLLNAGVWNGSDGIVHARDMLNDWSRIYARSHIVSQVYNHRMCSLVSRTTYVTVSCSQEVITAFCSPSALYFSMNVYR